MSPGSISIDEVKDLLKQRENVLLLDVRSEEEFNSGHIKGAIHVALNTILAGTYIPTLNAMIITVCGKGGGRSAQAAEYLNAHFANTAYYLEGGTMAWMASKAGH